MSTKSDLVQVAICLTGALVGFLIGAYLGFYIPWIFGPVLYGPEFIQVGWIFLFITVPVGGTLGALIGTLSCVKRPNLLAKLLVPIVPFFIVIELAQYFLRHAEVPRNYALELTTMKSEVPAKDATGRKFVGTITADGVQQKAEGKMPAKFTYKAIRIDYQIALIDGQNNEKFSVEVFVDEKKQIEMSSNWRINGNVESMGISWWTSTGHKASADLKEDGRSKDIQQD